MSGPYRLPDFPKWSMRWDPKKRAEQLPLWFLECCARGTVFPEFDGDLTVRTTRGYERAKPGDWVLYGPKGGLSIRTPEAFRVEFG